MKKSIKRPLLAVLAAAMLVTLALGLVGCSGGVTPHEHEYEWTVTVPACVSEGKESNICTICGHVKESRTIKVSGHSYEWTTVVPASCTAEGVEREECTACHATRRTRTTAPAHSYKAIVTEGAHRLECTVCGDVTPDEPHVATGEWLSEDGYHYKACDVCGEKILYAAHIESALKYADDSKHVTECTICGAILSEGEHHISEELSGDNDYHFNACTDCGARFNVVKHTYNTNVSSGLHTDNDGYHYFLCEVCGLPCGRMKCYEASSGSTVHVDGDMHYFDCGLCHGVSPKEPHYAGPDAEYLVTDDGTQHYRLCFACKAPFGYEAHTIGPDGNCTVCGHKGTATVSAHAVVAQNESMLVSALRECIAHMGGRS